MLGATSCDGPFTCLTRLVEDHDPSGAGGPLMRSVVLPLVLFLVVILVGRVVRNTVDRAFQDGRGDAQVRTLVRNVGLVATWVVATLLGLAQAGINIGVLVTFGGVASLAIGLAFQDLLRNVLAGIFLLLEHPFRIGDLITVGDLTGVVQTIALRTTSLRTPEGRQAVVPNLIAFNGAIVNNSAYALRQGQLSITVPDDVDLGGFLRGVRQVFADTAEVCADPAAAVLPHLDADVTSLRCCYWVDYREHDMDAVTASVSERLVGVLGDARRRAAAAAAGHGGGAPG